MQGNLMCYSIYVLHYLWPNYAVVYLLFLCDSFQKWVHGIWNPSGTLLVILVLWVFVVPEIELRILTMPGITPLRYPQAGISVYGAICLFVGLFLEGKEMGYHLTVIKANFRFYRGHTWLYLGEQTGIGIEPQSPICKTCTHLFELSPALMY